ncbi:hypothetical protein ANI_1_1202024 [Paecilomyces variotii No. 5]|uniref:Uncharacterized protein n=1 Tax=Byssochlamys spectabilis (strain No. 5 / NBRC 109023) TaxID=1356009 RepID=V5FZV8_BYSSN|nr:hypothetical protein ANI_1_1202024 [Paecilomyces variotii No. 5]
MLLTLKPPSQNGIKGPHEYSIVRQSIPTSRTSSTPPAAERTTPPASARRAQERTMDTARRGLPPPSSMTLPPPDAGLPAMAPMGQLPPPPPPQWQNSDDSMRNWLQSKAEEERRKQEEEKTRQETIRLEQRKIEQSILRESIQAGVPPHLIPLIFAGIAGGSTSHATLELIQQSISQTTAQTQAPQLPQLPPTQPPPTLSAPPPAAPSAHQSPLQPEIRRDHRAIPPNPYGAQAVGSLSQQTVAESPPQPLYGHSRPLQGAPIDPRTQPTSSLSRLNTAEMHIHPPPANVGAVQYPPGPPQHPAVSVKQESQQQRQASPSIYFHHWVPPGQSQPNTPSGKSSHESPYSSQPHSHLRSEYQNSPGRKRKSQGAHQPAPPPSSHPAESSPATSHKPSRQTTPGGTHRRSGSAGHLRQRSDGPAVYEPRYEQLREAEEREPASRSPPTGGSRVERVYAKAELRDQKHETEMTETERRGQAEVSQQPYYSEAHHREQPSSSYSPYSYPRDSSGPTATSAAAPENRPREPPQQNMGPPTTR